jgi:hypothetical protein
MEYPPYQAAIPVVPLDNSEASPTLLGFVDSGRGRCSPHDRGTRWVDHHLDLPVPSRRTGPTSPLIHATWNPNLSGGPHQDPTPSAGSESEVHHVGRPATVQPTTVRPVHLSLDDTRKRCQLVGTPSAECCSKSKFFLRENSKFNIKLSGNSRESSCRSSSSNLQNNFLVLCPQLHRVVVKHKV